MQEETEKRTAQESDKKELLKQLQEAKKESNILQAKLSSCIEKMIHFSTRNVNKRLKTQGANVQNFKNKVLEQEENIAKLQTENDNLSEKLEEALKVGLKLRKKKNYLSNKLAKQNPPAKVFPQFYVDELNQQLQFLEDEKNKLEEELENFMSEKVSFFHNGK